MFCLEVTAKEKRQYVGVEGGVVPTYTVWPYEDVILEMDVHRHLQVTSNYNHSL